MTNPRQRSDLQRKISLKSGWRKGAFCVGQKAQEAHLVYRENAVKAKGGTMSDIHPNDKVSALSAAISEIEANKARISLADYHLYVLRQMHAEAVQEARK